MKTFYKFVIVITLFIPVSGLFVSCNKTSSHQGYFYLPARMDIVYQDEPGKSGSIELEYNSLNQITGIKKTFSNNDAYILSYTYDGSLRVNTVKKITAEGTAEYEFTYDDINNSYIPLHITVATPDNEENIYPVTNPAQYHYQVANQTMHINPENNLLAINDTKITLSTNPGIFRNILFQPAFYFSLFDIDWQDFSFFSSLQVQHISIDTDNYYYTNERDGDNNIIKYEVFREGTQTKVMDANIQYLKITIPGE